LTKVSFWQLGFSQGLANSSHLTAKSLLLDCECTVQSQKLIRLKRISNTD